MEDKTKEHTSTTYFTHLNLSESEQRTTLEIQNSLSEEEVSEARPIAPDDVISDVDLFDDKIDTPPKINQFQGQMYKNISSNLNDLIHGSQILKGAFNQDIFTGKSKITKEDKPLITLKELKPIKPQPLSEVKKDAPDLISKDEYKPIMTRTNYKEHKEKVQGIVDMIQRNKKNYYYNISHKQAKSQNDMLASVNDSKTYLQVPNGKEPVDLKPLFQNKFFGSGKVTPVLGKLDIEYTKSLTDKSKGTNRIKSVPRKNTDRDYYLSLNTNQFKVKMQHLKKINAAIQDKITAKIIRKYKQIQLLKKKEKSLYKKGGITPRVEHPKIIKKSTSQKQFRGNISTERRLKKGQNQLIKSIEDIGQEIQLLESKKARFQSEYEQKQNKLKVEESEHMQMINTQYEEKLQNPKMKHSVTRKQVLLHDTLHSELIYNNKVTAYETKEGEQYTKDLLRESEEKDVYDQGSYLKKVIQKERKERELALKKRLLLKKRLASAKSSPVRPLEKRERCLSAVMIKQNEAYMRTMKMPYIPPEMMVGLHTISSNSKMWNQSNMSTVTSKRMNFSHDKL
jgi:hypothetical protein